VKRTRILVSLLAVLVLLTTSCGVGDKIASVSISAAGQTGVINLAGLGGTLQLQVMANYTSGKQIDETNFATYMITPQGTDDNQDALPTPPYGVQLNGTAMLTATANQAGDGICTWWNANTSTTGGNQPTWTYLGDYTIVATYRGFTSQPLYVPVASAASSQAINNGVCGPSSSTTGN
jgi:hypothetical protein